MSNPLHAFDPSDTADTIHIRLPGCRDCIHILRSLVEVMAGRVSLDALEVNRVALAVDELFANIISHGYGAENGIVEIEATIERHADGGSDLEFMLRDFAEPLHGENVFRCQQAVAERQEVIPGGLGMHLICSVMDEAIHEPLVDGNRWFMRYRCKGKDE